MEKIFACIRCGRPAVRADGQHCARCRYYLRNRPVKHRCPDCGNERVLRADTGRCVRCSRTCRLCGARVGRIGRDLCGLCSRAARRAAAQQSCPRCGKLGYLRESSGWCGPCSQPGRPANPPAVCCDCGQLTRLAGAGRCRRCWHRSPHRLPVRAANLAAELNDPPGWLGDFAAYLAPRYAPTPACRVLTAVGRLLADGGSNHPQAVLARCDPPDGPLARALEEFFTGQALALPTDRDERRAARRRRRRIDAVPEPLRPAVAGFAGSLASSRDRAVRAGTRPRKHVTIDIRLNAVRDFACFLTADRSKTDWATVEVADVEAFLGQRPSLRASRLTGLRQFFRYATHSRLVLVDPTRALTAPQPWGFRGTTLPVAVQRDLFRRWTAASNVHPHEAFVGLFALLHAATTTEMRSLTVDVIDTDARTVAIPGRRQPTPLDPWTWAALQCCLVYRQQLSSPNPHAIVTRQSKATRAPASSTYIKDTLDPVGIRPRILRSTRLVSMAGTVDPKLVAAAYGMTNDAVTIYLADRVDETRLEPPQ